jgi:hypothetical protein
MPLQSRLERVVFAEVSLAGECTKTPDLDRLLLLTAHFTNALGS